MELLEHDFLTETEQAHRELNFHRLAAKGRIPVFHFNGIAVHSTPTVHTSDNNPFLAEVRRITPSLYRAIKRCANTEGEEAARIMYKAWLMEGNNA